MNELYINYCLQKTHGRSGGVEVDSGLHSIFSNCSVDGKLESDNKPMATNTTASSSSSTHRSRPNSSQSHVDSVLSKGSALPPTQTAVSTSTSDSESDAILPLNEFKLPSDFRSQNDNGFDSLKLMDTNIAKVFFNSKLRARSLSSDFRKAEVRVRPVSPIILQRVDVTTEQADKRKGRLEQTERTLENKTSTEFVSFTKSGDDKEGLNKLLKRSSIAQDVIKVGNSKFLLLRIKHGSPRGSELGTPEATAYYEVPEVTKSSSDNGNTDRGTFNISLTLDNSTHASSSSGVDVWQFRHTSQERFNIGKKHSKQLAKGRETSDVNKISTYSTNSKVTVDDKLQEGVAKFKANNAKNSSEKYYCTQDGEFPYILN